MRISRLSTFPLPSVCRGAGSPFPVASGIHSSALSCPYFSSDFLVSVRLEPQQRGYTYVTPRPQPHLTHPLTHISPTYAPKNHAPVINGSVALTRKICIHSLRPPSLYKDATMRQRVTPDRESHLSQTFRCLTVTARRKSACIPDIPRLNFVHKKCARGAHNADQLLGVRTPQRNPPT